jgi:hypothetical protein
MSTTLWYKHSFQISWILNKSMKKNHNKKKLFSLEQKVWNQTRVWGILIGHAYFIVALVNGDNATFFHDIWVSTWNN